MVDMHFRQRAIPFFLFILLAFSAPASPAAAATQETGNGTALSQQIESLRAEVTRLQALLAELQNDSAISVPYQSVLFPVAYESSYAVTDGQLDTDKKISSTVASLFALFVDTIGEENVATYVQEWRVFYIPESDLGAFVEYIPATDAWLVGVNREGYVAGDTEVATSFANLFIHEFGHIVLYEKSDFESNFTTRFWTVADTEHVARVAETASADRFAVLNHYYQNNSTRFVSDYATTNATEDLAETFLSFVREEKPAGTTIREQKILAFYAEADLVSLRSVLRANLMDLGAL